MFLVGLTEIVVSLQTIQAALKDEAVFFQKNYPALSSRNGTPFLARTLNKVRIKKMETVCMQHYHSLNTAEQTKKKNKRNQNKDKMFS